MSQEPAPHIAVRDLDAAKIGEALIRLGVISHSLGHEHAIGTLRPYCNHPERPLSPEAQFVYDMFCRRTPEIIDRWYGGEAGYLEMHPAHVLSTRIGARRTDVEQARPPERPPARGGHRPLGRHEWL